MVNASKGHKGKDSEKVTDQNNEQKADHNPDLYRIEDDTKFV
jgi:hypothetical protein